MAFGIDDAFMAAASGLSLADTLVRIVQNYSNTHEQQQFEFLLQEVRKTALEKIRLADEALKDFERLLSDKNVDLDIPIREAIQKTPHWNVLERHKLKQIQKVFNQFTDAIYSSSDDIVALAQCVDWTAPLGEAVVESADFKHSFFNEINNSRSMKEAISLLRKALIEQRNALSPRELRSA